MKSDPRALVVMARSQSNIPRLWLIRNSMTSGEAIQ
jgi:hypothetical protein